MGLPVGTGQSSESVSHLTMNSCIQFSFLVIVKEGKVTNLMDCWNSPCQALGSIIPILELIKKESSVGEYDLKNNKEKDIKISVYLSNVKTLQSC